MPGESGAAENAVEAGQADGRRLEHLDRNLWIGLLVPALSWAIHLQFSYILSAFACEPPWSWLLHAVTLVSLAGVALGGWFAYKSWYAVGRGYDVRGADAALGRARFMALGGMALAMIFALVVVMQWVPTLVIEPCRY